MTRLVLLSTILALTVVKSTAQAANAASMQSIVFTGRWDLRDPKHAITVNSGSYFHAQFIGTTLDAYFEVSLNQPPLPTLAWKIDDGVWQEAEITPKMKLAEGLPGTTHVVWLMVRGIDEHQNRWTQPLVGSVTFLGLSLPDGGQLLPPLNEWAKPKLKIEFLGDSITEGVLVQAGGKGEGKTSWPWQTDAAHNYASQTAMKLSAAWRQVGFGATGLAHGGSGGAAPALDSFNSFYSGCPRDDWQPDLVVINQGTNDSAMPPDQYRPLYDKYLAMIRQAYPKVKIAALQPFTGAQAASIKQVVEEHKAKGDFALYFIDTTGWYSGTIHPNAESSVRISDKLVAALQSQVLDR